MEDRYRNDVAVQVPRVLLPRRGTDYYKWAVVACDQYTSQPAYWEDAKRIVGKAPSTLELILPEAYLEKPGEAERIASIKSHMREYLDKGILEEKPQGFVLVTRTVGGATRSGLVMALDLEAYDYSKGSTTLIRATEGTIVSRIPPRLKIREGAPIELPHILVLIDDPDKTVIEPLALKKAKLKKLYDTDLMLEGGHITGHLVDGENDILDVLNALGVLKDEKRFAKHYGDRPPMLFAMGDGNHSFATAKANWEKIKETLPEAERADHPARYALVEVENVHDDGIVFEPIHRVVFGASGNRAIETILRHFKAQYECAKVELGRLPCAQGGDTHILPFLTGEVEGAFIVSCPKSQLAVGTLQSALDEAVKDICGAEIDYIHGADVVKELAKKGGAIGFLLPKLKKSEFFSTVIFDGALPRKTFSMGEANEKRYYLECRSLEKK
ncbi:MAG: DUF1015 domain-containing protein [Eubacteriales bacterium]|jgi:hypothetical protein|nr:DUF1015 domain-containing protein [Eubacteriales bacterium]